MAVGPDVINDYHWPLDEVALAVVFAAPSFDVIDFGTFAASVLTMYPQRANYAPLAIDADGSLHVQFPQLPRVWFISEDQHFIIQLQQNKLILNWRTVKGAGRYPGFEELFPRFKSAFETLQAIFSGRPFGLSIQQFELIYVNAIRDEFLLEAPTPFFGWEAKEWPTKLPAPALDMFQVKFNFPDQNVLVKSTIAPGFSVPLQTTVFNFILQAVGKADKIDVWFSNARLVTRRVFEDMLSPSTRSLWGVFTEPE